MQANIPDAVLCEAAEIAAAIQQGEHAQILRPTQDEIKLKTIYTLAHKVACVVQAAKKQGGDFDAAEQLSLLQEEARLVLWIQTRIRRAAFAFSDKTGAIYALSLPSMVSFFRARLRCRSEKPFHLLLESSRPCKYARPVITVSWPHLQFMSLSACA